MFVGLFFFVVIEVVDPILVAPVLSLGLNKIEGLALDLVLEGFAMVLVEDILHEIGEVASFFGAIGLGISSNNLRVWDSWS